MSISITKRMLCKNFGLYSCPQGIAIGKKCWTMARNSTALSKTSLAATDTWTATRRVVGMCMRRTTTSPDVFWRNVAILHNTCSTARISLWKTASRWSTSSTRLTHRRQTRYYPTRRFQRRSLPYLLAITFHWNRWFVLPIVPMRTICFVYLWRQWKIYERCWNAEIDIR